MKKIIKLIAVVMITVIISISFCGCYQIDEMKEKRAVWTNKNHTALQIGKTKYRILPETDLILPDTSGDNGNYSVVKEDVPVLLSGILGENLELSKNKEIACTDYAYYYARDDVYEKYVNAILHPKLDCFYSYKHVYIKGKCIPQITLLTAEQINYIMSITNDENHIDYYDEDYYYSSVTFYQCDKDVIVRDNTGFDLMVDVSGKSMIIRLDGEIFEVPQDKLSTMLLIYNAAADEKDMTYFSD